MGDFIDGIKAAIWLHMCAKLFAFRPSGPKTFQGAFWHATKGRNTFLFLPLFH